MSIVTDKKLEEMQRIIDGNTIEIKNLKKQLEEYQKKCAQCSNNRNNEKKTV